MCYTQLQFLKSPDHHNREDVSTHHLRRPPETKTHYLNPSSKQKNPIAKQQQTIKIPFYQKALQIAKLQKETTTIKNVFKSMLFSLIYKHSMTSYLYQKQ